MYISYLIKLVLTAVLLSFVTGCSSDSADTPADGQTTLIRIDDANTTACPAGGVVIYTGMDANENSVLDSNEEIGNKIVCNGENGVNGIALSSLDVAEVLAVGSAACPNGGARVHFGLDLNNDSNLTTDEYMGSLDICNGKDGLNGTSLTSLSISEVLAVGSLECPNGGAKVHFGVDLNNDSNLTTDEYMSSIDICNGEGLLDENSSVPMLLNSTGAVFENAAYGTVVGTITILDNGDLPITAITLSDSGSENFTVSDNGVIIVGENASLDYETTPAYTLTAIATNTAGDSSGVTVSIAVVNIAETVPTLANTTATVDENVLEGTVVGNIIITDSGDSDITGITLSGTGSDDFTANADGTVRVNTGASIDYETKQDYNLTAIATNAAGNSNSETVHITVNDIAERVPTLAAFTGSVAEDAVEGTVVGDITITESGDSAITAITLTGSGSNNFEVATDGTITVKPGSTLDFETTPTYNLTAVAMNNIGSSIGVPVVITLTNYLQPFEIARIQADDIQADDYFGSAVAMSGDYMVVGVGNEDSVATDSGSAYLFKKEIDGNFTQIAKIQADDAQADDFFGKSIAISGNYIVVGAYREDTVATDAGSAYIFKRNSDTNVSQIAKIQASDAEAGDYFGSSVSISGDYIIVGADRKDTIASNAGSAYLFKRNSDTNVSQIAKIQASDAEANDYFGSAVSINGNYMVVGAIGEDSVATNTGSAYVFKISSDSLNDVIQIAKIQAVDPEADSAFGTSVSINGDYIIVSAPLEDTSAIDTGSAYLFKRDSDTLNDVKPIAKLLADDAEIGDYFGHSVSISGDYIIVSAYQEDTTAHQAGSVYLFKRDVDFATGVLQIAKLQAGDAEAQDLFGSSVFISGDNVVIGATNEDTTASSAGKVYMYDLEPIKRPYIYNVLPDEISYKEEFFTSTILSLDVMSPSGDITYALSGVDADKFVFTENNLSYVQPADFETPEDAGVDNDYNITVTATDINSISTSVDLGISVKDSYYLYLARFQANDTETNDFFGNSVAISGDYIIVGAYREDTPDYDAGSAYLFKKETDGSLTQIAKIQADDTENGDHFGYSVAISDDYIVVGADGEDTTALNAGSAYIFKRNSDTNVSQIAKVQASDAEAGDSFGSAVSISGNYIIVGAYQEDTTAINAGSAYIFKRNSDTNVSQIAKVQASDTDVNDYFGSTVSISGNYIIVGAYQEDTTALNAGSAYIFKRNSDTNVSQIAKVQASDAEANDNFGSAVSISGNYIIVGADGEDTTALNAGSAYLFKRNSDTNVSQIAKIQASDAEAGDSFGSAVSISGNYIIAGAYREDTVASNAGSAYLFRRVSDTNVSQIEKVQANDPEGNDNFGSAVSISGDNIVVGANQEDTAGSNAGSAYLFIKDPNQVE